MSKKQGSPHQMGLMLIIIGIVFISMLVNMLITSFVVFQLARHEIILLSQPDMGIFELIFYMALISIPVGMVLSIIVTKLPLQPIQKLILGMNRLADGHFDTRIHIPTVLKTARVFADAETSFNKMAQELQRTEMLRSDFVNNFSHEFKTPIVSIAGFARLLNSGELSDEMRREYLRIIEEESLRLSCMATNVLNLTKIENQSILTDVTRYNLSEQVRSCILLLEDRWGKKELDFDLNFDEHEVLANEELMRQVFINLLDNAVKFSPKGGCISLEMQENDSCYLISITNTGPTIPEDQQEKIFNKFYQADESHSTMGNGVGLAIVRRILELHHGKVWVTSHNRLTTFFVELPRAGAAGGGQG